MRSVGKNLQVRAITAFVLLAVPSLACAADAPMMREFTQTCFADRSSGQLEKTLDRRGWTRFVSISDSHLEREIAAVTPMLTAQGLSSDYVVYGKDVDGRHFELALSKTEKPVDGAHLLVGCSMYDFAATRPIDDTLLSALVPTTHPERSVVGGVPVTKWESPFGEGSGMRAVFVPQASPAKGQLGFTGAMLGTHFLDPAP